MMAGSANSPETRVTAGLDHSELSEPEPGTVSSSENGRYPCPTPWGCCEELRGSR